MLKDHSIEKAAELARKAHAGQKYGRHDYFEYHIKGVVKTVAEQNEAVYNDGIVDEMIVVAYLHDVLEDTDIPAQLLADSFSPTIAYAVLALTKREDEEYGTYIKRLFKSEYAGMRLARAVKVADSTFNLENSIASRRIKGIKKYSWVLGFAEACGNV